jgi:hypothetical protein
MIEFTFVLFEEGFYVGLVDPGGALWERDLSIISAGSKGGRT